MLLVRCVISVGGVAKFMVGNLTGGSQCAHRNAGGPSCHQDGVVGLQLGERLQHTESAGAEAPELSFFGSSFEQSRRRR